MCTVCEHFTGFFLRALLQFTYSYEMSEDLVYSSLEKGVENTDSAKKPNPNFVEKVSIALVREYLFKKVRTLFPYLKSQTAYKTMYKANPYK